MANTRNDYLDPAEYSTQNAIVQNDTCVPTLKSTHTHTHTTAMHNNNPKHYTILLLNESVHTHTHHTNTRARKTTSSIYKGCRINPGPYSIHTISHHGNSLEQATQLFRMAVRADSARPLIYPSIPSIHPSFLHPAELITYPTLLLTQPASSDYFQPATKQEIVFP